MSEMNDYEALLNEDDITAVKERREAIGKAVEDLFSRMAQVHEERKTLDAKDEQLYALARKLDDAHARLTRGVRYTEKAKKRLVRRFWDDATYDWVERFLLHWVRKQLQEGAKQIGSLYGDMPGTFAMDDVIKLMQERPEEFEYAKGPKPERKYARADYVWSLKSNPRRYAPPSVPTYWNVEAAFMAEGQQQRHRTFSEAMHEMLEPAIQSYYAKQSGSVVTAFIDLYFRDFARAYHSLKQAYEFQKIESEVRQKLANDQQEACPAEEQDQKPK